MLRAWQFFLVLDTLPTVKDDERISRKKTLYWVVSRKGICCGNHLSPKQVISQTVNLLVGYLVGSSQENSTRSLFLISILFIQIAPGPCYYYLVLPYSPCFILMSASLPTQGHHMYSMCPNVIFQTFLLCSRLMTSHHVTCHVTSFVTCLLHCLSRK